MKFTLATKITLSRILLTIPSVAFYIAGQFTAGAARVALLSVACILFAIACITDCVDGIVARSTHSVSILGSYLDPIADKINICFMLFAIVCFGDGLGYVYAQNVVTVAVLGGVIIVRELLIGMLRTIAAKRGKVISADVFGKIKTVFLNIGVNVLIVAGLLEVFAYIGTILYYIGAIVTVISGVHYFVKNASVLKDDGSDEIVAQADDNMSQTEDDSVRDGDPA